MSQELLDPCLDLDTFKTDALKTVKPLYKSLLTQNQQNKYKNINLASGWLFWTLFSMSLIVFLVLGAIIAYLIYTGESFSAAGVIVLIIAAVIMLLISAFLIFYSTYKKLNAHKRETKKRFSNLQVINEIVKYLPGLDVQDMNAEAEFDYKNRVLKPLHHSSKISKKSPLVRLWVEGKHQWLMQTFNFSWTDVNEKKSRIKNWTQLFVSDINLDINNRLATFNYQFLNPNIPIGVVPVFLNKNLHQKTNFYVNRTEFLNKFAKSSENLLLSLIPNVLPQDIEIEKINKKMSLVLQQQKTSWLLVNGKIGPYQYNKIDDHLNALLEDAYHMYKMLCLLFLPLSIYQNRVMASESEVVGELTQILNETLQERTRSNEVRRKTAELFNDAN
ncbi:hypothetical protein [Mycoplasmopsis agassizii]|uniref:DUF3137 domain-containing protein n=1 Tax=Mycoplasmopsis agassizii TaxID=33922 RepID=A0ABX4H5J7_9BACT|nr:hypothetical protein [Mycoplasmopsis agassizii]PAF55169.1 hypothetical protein CJF60_00585 [Mycoplasmopsis agassizii]SMC16840.1 hypothetical protein SAMN02745179_00340 [Mycoplasmopsis agassizii]